MGKRKQECPRKLPGEAGKTDVPASEVSRLEDVIKKLKSGSSGHNSQPVTATVPTIINSKPTITHETIPASELQSRPLDLRLPKSLDDNKCPTVFRDRVRNQVESIISGTADSALDLSKSTANLNQHHRSSSSSSTSTKVSPATSTFQQLSARLEEYFSTGIVASKFPRKLVRGQDVWMQDIEQKRAILKCLKCGASYNTLAELSKHIRKTGHHEDVLSHEQCKVMPLPPMKRVREDSPLRLPERKTPSRDSLNLSPAPSRPLGSPRLPERKTPSRNSLNLSPPSRPLGTPDRESAFKPITKSKGTEGFRARLSPLRVETSAAENPMSRLINMVLPASFDSGHPKIRPDACAAGNQPDEMNIRTGASVVAHGVEQKDKPIENREMPASGDPLCALKKFLDFGLPRLKPTGIDGGRI